MRAESGERGEGGRRSTRLAGQQTGRQGEEKQTVGRLG